MPAEEIAAFPHASAFSLAASRLGWPLAAGVNLGSGEKLVAAMIAAVLWLHLLPAAIAGFLVYALARKLEVRLRERRTLSKSAKAIAVGGVFLIAALILAGLGIGIGRLVDLPSLGWEPHAVTAEGLQLAATCTIAALNGAVGPVTPRYQALYAVSAGKVDNGTVKANKPDA